LEECGPCTVFANFALAFALQLKKKHGKTSVRVRQTSFRIRKTSVRVKKNLSQSKEKPQSELYHSVINQQLLKLFKIVIQVVY